MYVGDKYKGLKMLSKSNHTSLQHVHNGFLLCTYYWRTQKEENCKQNAHGNVQLMVQVNSGLIESIVVFNSINSAMLTDRMIAPYTLSHNEETPICPS